MATPPPSDDELDGLDVRYVQPYEATKRYLCPGCSHDIPPGTHHVVAVPRDDPADRRHWHRPCWEQRHRRRPNVRRRPR